MAEREYPAQIVIIEYECPECGEGFMRQSRNAAMLSDPPQYWHSCTECGHEETFRTTYPRQEVRKR